MMEYMDEMYIWRYIYGAITRWFCKVLYDWINEIFMIKYAWYDYMRIWKILYERDNECIYGRYNVWYDSEMIRKVPHEWDNERNDDVRWRVAVIDFGWSHLASLWCFVAVYGACTDSFMLLWSDVLWRLHLRLATYDWSTVCDDALAGLWCFVAWSGADTDSFVLL